VPAEKRLARASAISEDDVRRIVREEMERVQKTDIGAKTMAIIASRSTHKAAFSAADPGDGRARSTGHELLAWQDEGDHLVFLVKRGGEQ
jgi:hypothetical protein